ncbi:response regulator transcription factor [Limnochorda pilosa]|uniref:Transcriptional regulator n=1 Tax=Limnochorda pilosa TaxID=1555112 RepID=A0A0K2SG55_LIMPI|nr:response regulator transcription factor [Limnochorda pilosa]BAS26022.1 transcriptional regulator [Limnochorda pilosa]
MRILVVDDDPQSLLLLEKFLRGRGHQVASARDGSQALTQFVAHDPQLVLLDVMMPERSGWDVLAEIRETSQVPVIMVTVRDATEDKVRGLKEGADDYVTKPFDLSEIEARIEAVQRRYRAGEPMESHMTLGPLEIDDRAKRVLLDGREIRLSPKEYQVLSVLARRPGRVLSAAEIARQAWSRPDATPEDVSKYVYLLRHKLQRPESLPEVIRTVRGFGYQLDAGVGDGADETAEPDAAVDSGGEPAARTARP